MEKMFLRQKDIYEAHADHRKVLRRKKANSSQSFLGKEGIACVADDLPVMRGEIEDTPCGKRPNYIEQSLEIRGPASNV